MGDTMWSVLLIAGQVLAGGCCGSPVTLSDQLWAQTNPDSARQILPPARPPIGEWRNNFNPDGTPKPLRDPADTTLWPNTTSRANSDIWIARNHDRIRQMRPRILVINFANRATDEQVERIAWNKIAALNESSRYHGFANPEAPMFLEFGVWRVVNLGEPDGPADLNSTKAPVKPGVREPHVNCDYGAFFSDAFARHIGVRDPRDRNRYLNLVDLVDMGYVHEVWFTAEADGVFRCLEVVELKPQYDENFEKVPGKYVQSGNGGDPDQPWTGRSVRLNMMNIDRGIGCSMENLGHGLEGMAHGGAIPYFRHYFYEFAGFDLDTRFKLPWNSFYPLWGENRGISYPNPNTAVVRDGDRTWRLENYVAFGGNVHFPPNARGHYDQSNMEPVMSTIKDWRIGSGPSGRDIARPWTAAELERYARLAPDCMGKWMVYWRQAMPGYRNRSKDSEGKPMKNWWPFLFY